MNVEEVNGFYGSYVPNAHQDAFAAFFEQAYAVRERLGPRSYLLDNYLNQLLTMLIPTDAEQVATYGSYAISSLRSVCADIVRGRGKQTGHPFYKQASTYIEAHPLPFRELLTCIEFYVSSLLPAFLDSAFVKDGFLKKMHLDSLQIDGTDQMLIVDLFNRMSAELKDETLLQELNLRFKHCFIRTTSLDVFIASATCDWIYSLVTQDKESGATTLQLLLSHLNGSAIV